MFAHDTSRLARPGASTTRRCARFILRRLVLDEATVSAVARELGRTDVVGIFPDRDALIGLVGAVLAEQHDEWTESRRYLGLDVLARARAAATTAETTQEATTELVSGLSA